MMFNIFNVINYLLFEIACTKVVYLIYINNRYKYSFFKNLHRIFFEIEYYKT